MLFGLAMPDLLQLLTLAAIGLGGGIGHLLFLRAARLSPANHIAPTQYSQLAWAIVLGALFYSEFPDAVALVGLSIVLGAGLLNVLPQDRCIAVISRFSMAVRRRREAVPCTSPAETSLTPEL